MKVKQLIEYLSGLDQNLDVICHIEDEGLTKDGSSIGLFEIEAVDTAYGIRIRDQDHRPVLKIEQGPYAERIALLNITSDF